MNIDLEIRAKVPCEPYFHSSRGIVGIPLSEKSVKFPMPLPNTRESEALKERILKEEDIEIPMDRSPDIHRGDSIIIYGIKGQNFPANGYDISQIDVLREDNELRVSYFIHKK